MFDDRDFAGRFTPLGGQLDQLGAADGADRLLFLRRRPARRARAARSPSRCRPAISATCSPAMSRRRWGCRSRRLIVATNVNDILHRALSRRRLFGTARSRRPPTPSMDIQVSSQFRAAAVRSRTAATARALAAAMHGFERDQGDARSPMRSARRAAADFASERIDHRRHGAGDALGARARRAGDRSAHRDRPRRRARAPICRRDVPVVTLATAHPAKFGDAVERAIGVRARAARAARRSVRARGTLRDAARRPSTAVDRLYRRARGRRARHDRPRSIAWPTASPSRSSRWRASRRSRSASMPMSAAAPSRRTSPASPTWSSIWCSRAPASRDARAIAEAIEDVGGQLNAWTARDTTVFHARAAAGRSGARRRSDRRSRPRADASTPRNWSARSRSCSPSSARRATRPTTSSSIISPPPPIPARRYGRPGAGRRGDASRRSTSIALRRWLDEQYRPTGLVLAAAGKVDEDALLKLAEARFGDLAPGRAAGVRAGALHRRRRSPTRAASIRSTSRFAHPGVDQRHRRCLCAQPVRAARRAAACRRGCSRRCARSAGWPIRSMRGAQAAADTGLLGVYLAAAKARCAARLRARPRGARRAPPTTLSEAELARAQAQAKAGLLMGLESVQARCDHLARQMQVHGRIVPVAETVATDRRRRPRRMPAAPAPEAIGGGIATASVGGKLARVASTPDSGGSVDCHPHHRALGRLRPRRFRPWPQARALWPLPLRPPRAAGDVGAGRPTTGSMTASSSAPPTRKAAAAGIWNATCRTDWPLGWQDVKFHAANTPFRHLAVLPRHGAAMGVDARSRGEGDEVMNLFGYTGVGIARTGRQGRARDPCRCVEEVGRAGQGQRAAVRHGRSADPLDDRRRRQVHRARGAARAALCRHHARSAQVRARPDGRDLAAGGGAPRPDRRLREAARRPNSKFLVLTVYAVRMSALAIAELLRQATASLGGRVEGGEMAVREEARGLLLPTAIFARWLRD